MKVCMRSQSFFLIIFLLLNSISTLAFGPGGTGGGSTILADPIDTFSAQDAFMDAKRIIYMHLRAMDYSLRKNPSQIDVELTSVYSKVLYSKPSMFEVLDNFDIYAIYGDLCRDSMENPVDASIFGPHKDSEFGKKMGLTKDTICVSLKELKNKLTIDSYYNQIIALVAHEFSHLAGASEDEATLIQRHLFRSMTYSRGLNLTDLHDWATFHLEDVLKQNESIQDRKKDDYLCSQIPEFSDKFLLLEGNVMEIHRSIPLGRLANWKYKFEILSPEDRALMLSLRLRASYMVSQYARLQPVCDSFYRPSEYAEWAKMGEEVFSKFPAGVDYMDITKLYKNVRTDEGLDSSGLNWGHRYAPMNFPRVTSVEQARQEMDEIAKQLSHILIPFPSKIERARWGANYVRGW